MKYLLMLHGDDDVDRATTPQDMEALVAGHGEVMGALREAGKLIGSGRLRFSDEARTLRREGDGWLLVDGPFAETKEQFGGFYLIEADSKEEAIEWAKRLPGREDTATEVRPCRTGAEVSGAVHGKEQHLILFVARVDEPLTREEIFRAIDRHYELSIELASQGQFVSSRSLDPPSEASTVRWRDGRPVVTDGPFAETKEFAAGYFVVSVDSQEEAIGWAKQLAGGSAACEVRPLWS